MSQSVDLHEDWYRHFPEQNNEYDDQHQCQPELCLLPAWKKRTLPLSNWQLEWFLIWGFLFSYTGDLFSPFSLLLQIPDQVRSLPTALPLPETIHPRAGGKPLLLMPPTFPFLAIFHPKQSVMCESLQQWKPPVCWTVKHINLLLVCIMTNLLFLKVWQHLLDHSFECRNSILLISFLRSISH